MALQVLLRDKSLAVVAELTGSFTVDATVRADMADDGTLTFPASNADALGILRQPGVGVVLLDAGQVMSSGPVRSGAVTRATDDVPGTATVSWIGDTTELAGRLVWPVPSAAVTGQTVPYYGIATQPAESALLRLVSDQTGPTARADLQIPGLLLPTSGGRGAPRKVSARFTDLADEARTLAADDLGFRLVHDTQERMRLDVYQPRDRTDVVTFSAGLGSLPDYGFTWQAPTVTRVLVAAAGDGAARVLREFPDLAAEAAWSTRVWEFVDRRDQNPADDPEFEATVAQEAADRLRQGGPQAAITLSPVQPVDGPQFGPGGDYWLKDLVGYELEPGITETERLRAMHITYSADSGLVYQPVVGGQDAADPDPVEIRRVRALETRLLRLLASK
jgi:hypothetical protein